MEGELQTVTLEVLGSPKDKVHMDKTIARYEAEFEEEMKEKEPPKKSIEEEKNEIFTEENEERMDTDRPMNLDHAFR